MPLSLRHFSGFPETDAPDREALVVQLEFRIDALAKLRLRHRECLSSRDRGEIQSVIERGHMDLRKSPAILLETTRYVGRFHHHILLKLTQ